MATPQVGAVRLDHEICHITDPTLCIVLTPVCEIVINPQTHASACRVGGCPNDVTIAKPGGCPAAILQPDPQGLKTAYGIVVTDPQTQDDATLVGLTIVAGAVCV